MATPSVRFVIGGPWDGQSDTMEWTPVDQLDPAAQLARWTATSGLSCCALQGGFLISADGQPWNPNAIDELSMAPSWLQATEALLAGATTQSVWAWEESDMTLIRRGEDVEMYDVHHSGSVVCPLVRFPLRDFARALADAAEAGGRFLSAALALDMPPETREVLEHNLRSDWADAARRLREAAALEVQPPARAPEPSALHLAIVLDDLPGVRRALEREGPDVREADQPALCEALNRRRGGAVRALLAAGADPECRDRHGITALTVAARAGEAEAVAALLQAGADPTTRPDWRESPLRAVAQGAMYRSSPGPIFDLLRAAGAELDLACAVLLGDRESTTRLAHQVPEHPDILGLWVQRLRQETYRERDGSVAARVAWWAPAVEALRAAGASLHDQEGEVDPPLHAAVLTEDPELVRAVLALGADPRAPGRDGRSALEMAEAYGLARVVEVLERR